MTPRLLLLSVAMIMLLAGGCGKEPVGTETHQGALVLEFEFRGNIGGRPGEMSPSKLDIDSLSLEISGSGMDTMEHLLQVEDGVAEGVIEGIPAGSNRTIYALAWSDDPTVDLYEGRDTVTIEAGRVTETTLIMTRLRDDIVAHLFLMPESTFVSMPVIADASLSFDYYLPDSLLLFRFLLDGEESRGWGPLATDTLYPTTQGSHTVSVEVRNTEETTGQTDAMLTVLNRSPMAPTDPSPENGDTVTCLTPILEWSAVDPDSDDLLFIVWIGDDSLAVEMENLPAQMMESEVESVQVGPFLPETRYYWKVTALDAESSTHGDLWSFWVPPAPIDVDPDSVVFPCELNMAVVTLYNLTTGTVNWSVAWSADWLEVVPTSGAVGRTPQPVSLSVNSRSGYEPGFVDDLVTFTADGFTIDVFARLEIAPDLAQPLPDSMILTEPMFMDSVLLGNGGCGDLVWAVDGIQGAWLSVIPTDGLVAEEATASVVIVADTSGLSPGGYTGRADFDIVESLHSITIMLEIPSTASLDVEPDSLQLGPDVFSAACSLYNRGTVQVEWIAQWTDGWLMVTPDNGTLNPHHAAEIEINADAASLPSGQTEVAVTFIGGESPETLHVDIVVPGEPLLLLSPRSVSFPADTDTAGFQVQNIGTGNLSWYVAGQPEWCQISPSSGIVHEAEQRMVSLHADRGDLTPGSYSEDISISSNGGSDVLRITLEVGAAGCDDPVYYENFNTGAAPGWQPYPGAGNWTVQDGRYMVSAIFPDSLAWSDHTLSIVQPLTVQADTRFPPPPNESGIVAVFVDVATGYALEIDGKTCDAVGAGLKWDGYVFAVARQIVTEEWFAFGAIQEVALFSPGGWNTIAIAMDNSHFHALVNGIVEISVPHVGGTIPVESIGLLGTELDVARFDRIYVCSLEG